MATKDDRRAALLLLVVALAGGLVRLGGLAVDAPGAIGYQSGSERRPGRDSVDAAAARMSRPLGMGERIDLDRAEVSDLARLPRIGPAMAARIVNDRKLKGPFGSLEEVARVRGVGPALLEAIRAHSTFSGVARREPAPASGKVRLNTAPESLLRQLPGIGPVKARAIVEDRRRHGPYRTIEDLVRVSGIGTATVERLRDLVIVR